MGGGAKASPPPFPFFLSLLSFPLLGVFDLPLLLFIFFLPRPVGTWRVPSVFVCCSVGRVVFGPFPLIMCFPAGVPLVRLCSSRRCSSVGFRRILIGISSVLFGSVFRCYTAWSFSAGSVLPGRCSAVPSVFFRPPVFFRRLSSAFVAILVGFRRCLLFGSAFRCFLSGFVTRIFMAGRLSVGFPPRRCCAAGVPSAFR